jgi:hypothetical protein
MSEFTFGLLYRHADASVLDPLLDEIAYVNDHDELNEGWHVATVDMDAIGVLFEPESAALPEEVRQMKQATLDPLLALSRQAPVLFFYNAGDHGWGYRLFRAGTQAAAFDFSYEAESPDAAINLAARHPEQFAGFGLTPEAQHRLSDLLDEPALWQALSDGSYFDLVERFKQILGIEEMTWIP